ncbi:hypothetical protein O181_043413 [Austropuccinia psidii MF-1]|uniref:Uncharacterized protein n=1 Tax=Austropuccinia psidii MF-1 TaxID=1389203 RepID=A0A9Q3DN27_9BASI|nr:hypothetical protein [Austropuccinia psidii MF-1]
MLLARAGYPDNGFRARSRDGKAVNSQCASKSAGTNALRVFATVSVALSISYTSIETQKERQKGAQPLPTMGLIQQLIQNQQALYNDNNDEIKSLLNQPRNENTLKYSLTVIEHLVLIV